ncbi:MAG: translocation/assembly module TamB [Melioribacter sp.]|nr:translocation/assembly module TamB [Melioribacter sp.]
MAEELTKSKAKRSLFRKIINTFIAFFLIIIFLIVVFIGFSQTRTFREIFRKKIIELVNNEINGKLDIKKIDGTILTSLFLRNTSITIDNDTLFSANKIEIKTSPLQLFLKRIYIRKILIENANINFFQIKDGSWNFEKLLKPKPKDTIKSKFPFFIQVNNIKFNNINFVKQSFNNVKSKKSYPTINFDDLQIYNLNLSAQAFVDISNSDYLLLLNELSFRPNLTSFKVNNISGNFAITDNFVSISNFNFKTDSSNISLNIKLDSLNLFNNIQLDRFKNCPVSLDLYVKSFSFSDLSSFIKGTEFLKGNPSLKLNAKGKFGDFKIQKLSLDYKNSHFEITGRLLNLNKPEKLFIDAKIINTDINYKDVISLLPELKLPKFAKLSVSSVNVEFKGEPANFKTKFNGNIDDGKLSFDCTLNLKSKPASYSIKFKTGNLNLEPLIGFKTRLNSEGYLVGTGFRPSEFKSEFKFTSENSLVNEIPIDKFSVSANGADKNVHIDIEGYSKSTEAVFVGDIIFENDTLPLYSIVGSLKHLDLSEFTKNDKDKSNLNFYFSAEGQHIDPDKIVGTFSFGIDSSKLRNTNIKYSNIDLILKKYNKHRIINIVSDFIDFNIEGDFSLSQAIELLSYESKTISKIISDKINQLNPLNIISKESKSDTLEISLPEIAKKNLEFKFDFKLKDFSLLASILHNEKLDMSGSGKGTIKNISSIFTINASLNLDYLVLTQKSGTIYISNFETNINFTRNNNFISFNKLFGSASITGKRFYNSGNIKNIEADIVFNQSKLFFSASAEIENIIKSSAEGIVLIEPAEQKLLLNNLVIDYKNIKWSNNDTLKILFNPNYFKIENFALLHDTSSITISGLIEANGKQKLKLNANNLSGEILSNYLLGSINPFLKTDCIIDVNINGEFKNPIISANINMNQISYAKRKLGNLEGKLYYENKKVLTEFKFLDSTYSNAMLTVNGTIPIDLSFESVENRTIKNEEIDLKVRTNDFNINSLGNLLPNIIDQQGILKADISITGPLEKPIYTGFVNLKNANFKLTYNNLTYSCAIKLKLDKNIISVDSLFIANNGGTKYIGKIFGKGEILYDGFSIQDITINMNGSLAILSELSRASNPLIYGDLFIETNPEWQITWKENRLYFKGNILLKQVDLTYVVNSENYQTTNTNFQITYVTDSTKIDKEILRFNKILAAERNLQKQKENFEKETKFDYEIGIKVDNTARMTFILSQAANQKLFVETTGELKYEHIEGITRAQGYFQLIKGSKLEFFKTFDAEGIIRFESSITNPYLDIIATYTSDYINPRENNPTPQEVAIKIKINGPLSDLGKNLANNPESIGVYVGSKNIQNNIKDTRYDYSDAFSFILLGKFKDDLTAQDRAETASLITDVQSTATSFLGSMLTSFVNSAVGDLVNNIQISRIGEYTKFSFSGRIQNLRYSIGGTTEIFQNINKANIKIEYPFNPNFLIRVERKDPVVQKYSFDEKINELALKYRFIF